MVFRKILRNLVQNPCLPVKIPVCVKYMRVWEKVVGEKCLLWIRVQHRKLLQKAPYHVKSLMKVRLWYGVHKISESWLQLFRRDYGQIAAFVPQRPWGQYFPALLRPSVLRILPSWLTISFGICCKALYADMADSMKQCKNNNYPLAGWPGFTRIIRPKYSNLPFQCPIFCWL